MCEFLAINRKNNMPCHLFSQPAKIFSNPADKLIHILIKLDLVLFVNSDNLKLTHCMLINTSFYGAYKQ